MAYTVRYISDEQLERMKARKRAGASYKQISLEEGMSQSTVFNTLCFGRTQDIGQLAHIKRQTEEALRLRAEGWSWRKIGRQQGVAHGTVRRRAILFGALNDK